MNVENLWRLEHVEYSAASSIMPHPKFNVSPYTALNVGLLSEERHQKLSALVVRQEPMTECKIRKKVYGGRRINPWVNPLSALPPATWKHTHPGIFEDPFLREIAIKNFEKLCRGPIFIFGFDSLAQADDWLNDEEFRTDLHDLGFCLRRYRCGKVYHGLRQAVAMLDSTIEKTSSVQPLVWIGN
jgi:hypothetical protein